MPQLIRNKAANSTGFRGVFFDAKKRKFRAQLNPRNHPRISSNYFDSAIEAARDYDRLARNVYGNRAFLNFPFETDTCARENFNETCCRGHLRRDHGRLHKGKFRCRLCARERQQKSRELKIQNAQNNA